jgi:hypothetical protein
MSIYNPVYGQPSKNNGGITLNGGTPNSQDPSTLSTFSNKRRTEEFPFGSIVVDGVNITGANQNLSVPVPYEDGQPIIKRTLSTFTNSSVLLSPGNLNTALTSSIHSISTYRTRLEHQAYVGGLYNQYTGKFATGFPDNSFDDFGLDTAASVSRADQGSLFFNNHSKINTVSYLPKTG